MIGEGTREDFYEAAIRHWVGGSILKEKEEYDIAVCMQGFAAECALKKIWEKLLRKISEILLVESRPKDYSHYGDVLFTDIKMILSAGMEIADMIDPASGLRLVDIDLPQVLFQDHPDRRYFQDNQYSSTDAELCQNSAESLIQEMVRMRLDGYI